MEREKGGPSLWVYLIDSQGRRTTVRKVTWAFEKEGELEIGLHSARPTSTVAGDVDEGDELLVEFDDFEIECDGGAAATHRLLARSTLAPRIRQPRPLACEPIRAHVCTTVTHL